MKVVVGTAEKPRVLKAVVSPTSIWVSDDTGSVIFIGKHGRSAVSSFRTLSQVLAESPGDKTPIYEGDTITITF
jgi:hypothetical protein